MKLTSSEANKLLNGLNEEHNLLLRKETEVCTFVAATCENLEDARPDYDYKECQAKLAELEEKIRKIKHAINVFNVTHEIPGFDMTIDQALVYLPQLTQTKRRAQIKSSQAAKTRQPNIGGSSLIEYEYANYDVADAEADFRAAADTLAKLQHALDVENNTVPFEIDL